eukprot:57340_1
MFILIGLPLKWQYESDMAQLSYHMPCKELESYVKSDENREQFKNYLRADFKLDEFEFCEHVYEMRKSIDNLPLDRQLDELKQISERYISKRSRHKIKIPKVLQSKIQRC